MNVYILKRLLFLHVCLGSSALFAEVSEWTHLYRKHIDAEQQERNKQRSELAFAKHDVMPFTQLLFSWNMVRPKAGYVSFWVSARDAQTKKWYKMHKMAEWGADRQRSFVSENTDGSGFYHVRLELPKGKKADAFRVKVRPHDNGDLSLVRGLYVSLADMSLFATEVNDSQLNDLSSVYIKGIPRYSQMTIDHERADSMCSPTSCTMLVNFICKQKIDPRSFALNAHDQGLDAFGSWPFNTAHAFELCDGRAYFRVERLRSFSHLHRLLSKGIPVVVSVRGPLPGGSKEYEKGHLLVVVGYNSSKKTVQCHDPAFVETKDISMHYQMKDFLAAWERSRRLAYVAEPVTVV